MSALSVVHYNTSPHKLNILQHSTSANTNTDRREIIIVRKSQQILPNQKSEKQDILITNTARKRPKTGKEITRVHNPPPVAVARRNARERNRVKQVNNGFATLRQHIPNSIAAAFESNAGRGGNKKLSKVETLRMAVEYIRSLEDILAMDDSGEYSENISTSASYPSPSSSSPTFTNKSNAQYAYSLTSPSLDEDDLSTNPTPPPQQYIRIQGSSMYHFIPAHLYEDNNENLEPIDVDDQILSDPSLMDADFTGVQDLSLLSNIHTSASLSPELYSDTSSSPGRVKVEPQTYVPVFPRLVAPQVEESGVRENPEIKVEHPVLSIGNEGELPEDDKNNVIDVISWWEQQQRS